jgi:signal transduction histidine kinase
MRSLAFKLILGFLLISLVGVGLVAAFTRWATVNEFERLMLDQAEDEFVATVTAYYESHGSWDGVEQLFMPQPSPEAPSSPASRPPQLPFILVNEQNVVVLSDKPDGQSRPIPDDQLAQGRSLVVDGEVVGTVLPTGEALERDALAERYLSRTLQASGYAAVGATAAALLLAVLLASTLTRPLRELTIATKAVAQGDLEHQVPVRSKDELGELAVSFNQMSADLAQATAVRRQMTADIAHDLRSPLTAISGYVEAMRDGVLEPTPARFEAMYVETQRLRRLVDDLRTLSLTDAGELRLDRQAIPPRMLLERLAAVHRHRADEQEVAITIQAEPNTPDVHVDQDRMAQVLGNLIDNALRYTPPGGEITLGARTQGAATLLTVRDTGAGIPPEHLPHVFDRFYRGDSARSIDGGESGLGLAIAKAIVEAHGGTISVESTPGAGTTFTIALD